MSSPNSSHETSSINLSREYLPKEKSSTDGEEKALKRLTVTFQNIGVRVHGDDEGYCSTVASVVHSLIPRFHTSHVERHILQNVTGCVRPGEMLLVLGRPGSGCTSLLKILSNLRGEFAGVDGIVRYGNMGFREASKFRQQIVMNTEDDVHFPTLTVSQTMQFAASTKLIASRPEELAQSHAYADHMRDEILSDLGISHTHNTMVGNEYIRGISGGERKRVSLAETMATQGCVQCWDNSTRGLDASNALDYVRVLRRTASQEQKTVIATLYQAGNGIYDLFDKVLVLAEGREIYYGPRVSAKNYFEEMGFICAPGANVADFLTSVAVHTERQIVKGLENSVPKTAAEFEDAYKQSRTFEQMLKEIQSTPEQSLAKEAEALIEVTNQEQNRRFTALSRNDTTYTVSLRRQIMSCTKRQFQVLWGDRWTNILKIVSSVVMALVTGSLFYDQQNTSATMLTKPGALFFPILLFCLAAMSETTASFMGRPIVTRHKRFSFYRPTAFIFASVVTDVAWMIVLFTLFFIPFYFIVHLQFNAARFFTAWFVYLLITLCFTSFYRMIGAWNKHFGIASQISGWCTMVMLVYTGYLISFNEMRVWFRWIVYINPAYYAFEAVMANELSNLETTCGEPDYVPFGVNYNDNAYRACTYPASSGDTISGAGYLAAHYNYSRSHVWRNVGIIIGFWVFFATMTAIGFELRQHQNSGSQILYEKSAVEKERSRQSDEEMNIERSGPLQDSDQTELIGNTVFTFKDIDYFVHHEGREKQLLDHVSGFVKPGQLVALMGSSGAGKTTLMDVLAQRKDSGRIEGSIMINGRPQGISFQRTTGYCEQNDVHEGTATVRESLLFSARLRQSFETPDDQKVAYVEKIMGLLELTPIQHAVVGTPGSGLSIEQRKRLTLATELVAKPSLMFLDEPTSGLDGQSAYNIVRFMRKLVQSGQTVICTIHQPSAVLFEAFDVLLLLARGGRTTYFGGTGKDSSVLLDYFARNGALCPLNTNPAEHIVDVVQGRYGTEIDWPEVWNVSPERQMILEELDSLNQTEGKGDLDHNSADETHSFATPIWYQILLVTRRQVISLWRNPDYVWNKIGLHVSNSLFGGFTFWMISDSYAGLAQRLYSIFNFVFVAPGCINQLQPLFIHNRDIFETREKKSKTYHWVAFISAQLLSEIPLLIVCGTLYFACWYFTCGFPVKASSSGQVFVEMMFYELLYTAIGQAIAAYSPNELFAALANPVIIGAGMINFCGVVVPYNQIVAFWRYWIYWINPFTYLIGALMTPVLWDVKVECTKAELTYIPIPSDTNCGDYMTDFLSRSTGYIVDSANTTMCAYCKYASGAEYLEGFNIEARYYGWRDVGITSLFCISTYGCVFLMMKLRNKATKTAS